MPRSAPLALATLLASPASAGVTCFTHVPIATLPGTERGTAGPAVGARARARRQE